MNGFQKTDQVRARAPRAQRGRERGSAILEGALVLIPFLALLFALMDFSVAIFVQNVLRNAVREGTRFAISQRTGGSGQDAAVKAVVQQNSMNFLTDVTRVSITYYDRNVNPVTGVGSNAGGNIIVVAVTGYPWTWMAPFMRSSTSLAFSASSSDLMEAPPNGILPAR